MLAEKVVVITGAGRGLGRALAHAFSKAGCKLVLVARTEQELDALGRELSGDKFLVTMDVRNERECRLLMEKTADKFGRIDILINNAGVATYGLMEDLTSEQLHTMIQTNLLGTMYCSRAAWPFLLKQKSGHIINISSIAGKMGLKGETFYSASKWGVTGFSASLREEGKAHGIKVTAFCQGGMDTPFWDKDQYYKPDKSTFLRPEECAQLIVQIVDTSPLFGVEEIVINPVQSR